MENRNAFIRNNICSVMSFCLYPHTMTPSDAPGKEAF